VRTLLITGALIFDQFVHLFSLLTKRIKCVCTCTSLFNWVLNFMIKIKGACSDGYNVF